MALIIKEIQKDYKNKHEIVTINKLVKKKQRNIMKTMKKDDQKINQ